MANGTKRVLGEALKAILLSKPLGKVTVQEIADRAGVSRMTFYYHFQDVYALMDWVFAQDAERVLAGKRRYCTWQEGYLALFRLLQDDQAVVLNIYHAAGRSYTESLLLRMTEALFRDIVDELSEGKSISEADKRFIVEFYEYAFVGIMLRWIAGGMSDDPALLIEKQSLLLEGDVEDAVNRFCRREI